MKNSIWCEFVIFVMATKRMRALAIFVTHCSASSLPFRLALFAEQECRLLHGFSMLTPIKNNTDFSLDI